MAYVLRALAENAENLRNSENLHAHTAQLRLNIQTGLISIKKCSDAMDNIIMASEHFYVVFNKKSWQ